MSISDDKNCTVLSRARVGNCINIDYTIGLAPIAVRREVQTQGIGSRLIREGLRRCQELGYDYCVVLGNPEYYGRFGFETASKFGTKNEYGMDEEFMITRFSNQDVAGLIKYADEFARFSV